MCYNKYAETFTLFDAVHSLLQPKMSRFEWFFKLFRSLIEETWFNDPLNKQHTLCSHDVFGPQYACVILYWKQLVHI